MMIRIRRSNSTEYKNLLQRFRDICKRFLGFNPMDSTMPKNQDRIRAFILLVHAEIEFYLEKMARKKLDLCRRNWSANMVIPELIWIFLYPLNKYSGKPQNKEERIELAMKHFDENIKTNHGIKENNILKLFFPLGIVPDPSLISSLETLGEKRGSIAHTSAHRVTILYDKNTELSLVENIVKELREFDIACQSSPINPF